MELKNYNIYNTGKRQFQFGSIEFENDIITNITTSNHVEPTAGYIIPGLIDVHTHGRMGLSFPKISVDEINKIRYFYAKVGTVSLFPSVGSQPVDEVKQWIINIKEAIKQDIGANIDGIHLEGRYINVKRKGAHKPELISDLDCGEIAEILTLAKPLKVHVTAAPELPNGDDFIKTALSHGATFGIGHSDAAYDEAMTDVITSFTHTFNAMRPLHHREPGTVGAALVSDAYAEFICDGIHLHPAVIKLAYKVKAKDKFVLVTDSVAAAGLQAGKVTLSDGTLAGSTLDLYCGMMNLTEFCDIPLEEAINPATVNPAKMVGIDHITGSIEIGKRADLCIIAPDKKTLLSVYANNKNTIGVETDE